VGYPNGENRNRKRLTLRVIMGYTLQNCKVYGWDQNEVPEINLIGMTMPSDHLTQSRGQVFSIIGSAIPF
jgi:hypothetical protein